MQGMRDIQNIQVDNVIVHILDPGNTGLLPPGFIKSTRGGLLLSIKPINIAKNPDAYDFIKRHILSVLGDNNLRAAKFPDNGLNSISETCNGLIKKTGLLVNESQSIAEKLFGIMINDKRISACDLAVCLFYGDTEESDPKDPKKKIVITDKYLALLKLDPSSVFQNAISVTGGPAVDLEKINLVFTSERLQKAAIIQFVQPKNEYDMLLLDRQVSKEKGPEIAEFFRKDFLDCGLAFDDYFLTKMLYYILIRIENRLREMGFEEEAVYFSRLILQILLQEEFHFDEWRDTLEIPPENEKEVIEVILDEIKDLPQKNFKIDEKVSNKVLQKARYIGDHGLIVEIEANHRDCIKERRSDGTNRKWKITIETQMWRKVK